MVTNGKVPPKFLCIDDHTIKLMYNDPREFIFCYGSGMGLTEGVEEVSRSSRTQPGHEEAVVPSTEREFNFGKDEDGKIVQQITIKNCKDDAIVVDEEKSEQNTKPKPKNETKKEQDRKKLLKRCLCYAHHF
eukprot:TCONS_00022789-protein